MSLRINQQVIDLDDKKDLSKTMLVKLFGPITMKHAPIDHVWPAERGIYSIYKDYNQMMIGETTSDICQLNNIIHPDLVRMPYSIKLTTVTEINEERHEYVGIKINTSVLNESVPVLNPLTAETSLPLISTVADWISRKTFLESPHRLLLQGRSYEFLSWVYYCVTSITQARCDREIYLILRCLEKLTTFTFSILVGHRPFRRVVTHAFLRSPFTQHTYTAADVNFFLEAIREFHAIYDDLGVSTSCTESPEYNLSAISIMLCRMLTQRYYTPAPYSYYHSSADKIHYVYPVQTHMISTRYKNKTIDSAIL